MADDYFFSDISRHIWQTKYRFRDQYVVFDETVADSWRRMARNLAAVEDSDATAWEARFYDILSGFRFLPAGRIQAGAGTGREVTLFNCFVMGSIEDSMDGIFDALKEGALTMQQGGGVGFDFSTLRPRGTQARRVGAVASGPVSFMHIWDSMCATLLSTGARRGAMMATLRCDHPDIEDFIDAKRVPGRLSNFNLSVQVSDAFMEAVRNNTDWALVFPAEAVSETVGETVMRDWPNSREAIPCRVFRRVSAQDLWLKLMRACCDTAEPGVLFVDRINRMNNLYYREHITTSNPCGEVPLPPYGACNLGSINLTQFVIDPFSKNARLDTQGIVDTVAVAVRFLDNVISASNFPLERQREQALGTRRIGLGITGLGDALILMGMRYDQSAARTLAARIMRTICHTAYRASIDLARERGAFPFFDLDAYLEGGFIRSLPAEIRCAIAAHGIRNSHLTAIAPTGTISLLANNVSSGIEPVYDFCYTRRILGEDGSEYRHEVSDYALQRWRALSGDKLLPEAFLCAWDIAPLAHLDMQAVVQPFVDSAISKTVNVPENYPFGDFCLLYEQAYEKDLKGCTAFRPNPVTGAVLQTHRPLETGTPAARVHCCDIDREID